MLTRREVLRQVGTATALGAMAPWWLVRRAHAARDKKLIVWQTAALAPQVDKLLKDQCFDYAKQAGIKENEIDYSIIGSAQFQTKLVASLEAGNPPDVTRLSAGHTVLYRSQGHLMDVTDVVEKMQTVPGGLFPVCLTEAIYKGKAYGVPYQVSPWPLIARKDILDAAKVEPPKTWDEFVEVCKKLQNPPRLTGFGICLGLTNDADNNIMNVIWCHGGKLVEEDNKTVALNSPGTVQAVQLIRDMYHKHRIIPRGTISWDNTGNNKAYQSRQVIFVVNPTSIYAHLADSDKELYDVTGLFQIPAGPGGAIAELTTGYWGLFKQNPYPELAKGLVEYYMEPEHWRVVTEEGDGRWGPPYPQMYDSEFWKQAKFQHWRKMIETGHQFPSPGTTTPAAGEVYATNVIARMMQRVLVESVEPEQAVEDAHNRAAEIYARYEQG